MQSFCVGIGKWRGGTLAELEDDFARLRQEFDAPDDAAIARVAPGSTYAFEVIWSRTGKPDLDPAPVWPPTKLSSSADAVAEARRKVAKAGADLSEVVLWTAMELPLDVDLLADERIVACSAAFDAALDAYHAARLARDAADLADGLAEAGPALLRPWSVTLTNEPRPGQFRISGGAA